MKDLHEKARDGGAAGGGNTANEQAEEAECLGGPARYRMYLANALLGAVQTETVLTDTGQVTDDEHQAAAETFEDLRP
jgi:hypothetical protein